MNNKHVYSVSELTNKIKNVIRENIGKVWVQGEISNLKSSTAGHLYLTLKDEFAQISLAVFRNVNKNIKFKLEDGQKVLIGGEVTIYEGTSRYQMIVQYIEPVGIGSLQMAFNQLKEKLEKEGLFDLEYKKSLPYLPLNIGVVTSPHGAAIRDILSITKRRCCISSIKIIPAAVQGQKAAQEIADAINLFNELKNVDVIIVGRGGGSIEDLWAFNEEITARSIFNSEIPIISAVGHETDFTIADFVSDKRAPTPSAAAEIVVPDIKDLKYTLDIFYKRIVSSIEGDIRNFKTRVSVYANHYIFHEGKGVIRNYIQKVDDLSIILNNSLISYTKNIRLNFHRVTSKLEMLSPLKVLSRGYSISFNKKNKAVLKSVKDINEGDIIKTVLPDGEVESTVLNIKIIRNKLYEKK